GLMHQYVVMQEANGRLGTHKTKRRGEINRTHAKWYRQKGTGRARHGNRAAPIFVGGGRAHGPLPHKYIKDMPKKMRHAAIRSALSALLRDGQIVVVKEFTVDAPKTKEGVKAIASLVGNASALVLLPESDAKIENALRNLPYAFYLRADYMNVRDLLKYDNVIIPLAALDVIQRVLGKTHGPVAEK